MRPISWLALVLAAAGAGGCERGATAPPPPDAPVEIPTPPPMALHRLNRLEYDNTVRDLLGTSLRPADTFPVDPATGGFDNQAEALVLTPTLLDQYVRAARDVVSDALDPVPAFEHTATGEGLGIVDGQLVGSGTALLDSSVVVSVTVPTEGAYDLTLVAGGSRIGQVEAPGLALRVDGVLVDEFVVEGSAAQLVEHRHTVHLGAGLHTIEYVPTNHVNDSRANVSNTVTVQSMTARSEQVAEGSGRALVYVCEPSGASDDGCPDEILHRFAARAWRRPLSTEEEDHLSALHDVLKDQESPDDALRLVMRFVLTSPKFLYRAHHVDPDAATWRSYELASRLSYFLWSSMPDERLFEAAASGALATREGIADAARWMVQDPKAQGFLDGFAEQWLATRHLATASPSPEVYPTFDDDVRAAMVAEAKLLVGDFLQNGRPVVEMLAPGFGYRDDRLSAHYGMSPVGSDAPVRVPAAEGERQGVLALGSWLVAQSHSDRSSPILRGSWIADHILCKPVPAPPAGLDIGELEPPGEDRSVREALEHHRSDPVCAGCHAYLDVMGMGFEAFDGAGRQVRPEGLDTLGALPDGTPFEGASEFSRALDPAVFLRCVNEKLFVYGLGRSPIPGERALFDRPLDPRATLPDLVAQLVSSPQFQPSVEE